MAVMEVAAERRAAISAGSAGRTVRSLGWEQEGGYRVMAFTGGAGMCLRLMSELA